MELQITFKHLDLTPSLKEKIEEKSIKLKKYCDESVLIHWTCVMMDGDFTSEVTVKGKEVHAFAKAHDDNLYKTFDVVVSKLEKQLKKQKELVKERIHHRHRHGVAAICV